MTIQPEAAELKNHARYPSRFSHEGRTVCAKLIFAKRHGKTFLKRQLTPHPFHITRPFYFDENPKGMASLYLQSSAGGLYGDDDLMLDVRVEDNACAHVTTQASTVVHAARGGNTRNRVQLYVGFDGFLEYLPDPVILFSEARLEADLHIALSDESVLIVADAFLNHDPKGRDQSFDHYKNTISATRTGENTPFLIDRMDIAGAHWPAQGPAFAALFLCHGTLYVFATHNLEEAEQAIRRKLQTLEASDPEISYCGVEFLPDKGVLCVRVLARDGARFHTLLTEAAKVARSTLMGSSPARRPK